MPKSSFPIAFISFWTERPKSRVWLALPISYMIFLQFLTGLPKAETLRQFNANDLLLRFSEELFDYPYWIQDLSHLPLFLLLAWLWSWFLGPAHNLKSAFYNKALLLSLSYGFANELAQAFIPQRFPSFGDIMMNTIGVAIGILLHAQLCKRFPKN